jgi:hypothetical protein
MNLIDSPQYTEILHGTMRTIGEQYLLERNAIKIAHHLPTDFIARLVNERPGADSMNHTLIDWWRRALEEELVDRILLEQEANT